jgi:hypothetical protein
MTTYRAGQEIDSYCTKCKLDLTHKIIAVVSNKPAKVECRTCYGVHNYRAPKSAAAVASASSATPRAARSTSSRTASSGRSVDPEPPMAPPDHARIVLYATSEKFPVGTWLSHKVFGVGVVLREIAVSKIEVRFDSGTKVLVHGMTPIAS